MLILCENRKAKYDFELIKIFESGIELKGSEVKSIRMRHSSLAHSFCYAYKGEIFIKNYHITCSPYFGFHDSIRIKKLLLHKKEIRKIIGMVTINRYTIIPLKVYNKGQYIKIEIAVAKGKKSFDKRATLKKKTIEKEKLVIQKYFK